MWNKRILALGADIKNRFLLARGRQFYYGPQISDLSRAENYEFFKSELLRAVKKIKPNIVACDLHPNYFSSIFAKKLNLQLKTYSLKLIQHHHAHIASVMQEYNLKRPVLGVCFDGTGFGRDANSWGGEFLLVESSGFRRAAHLKYRMMPGADKVVSEPWRMAVSILGKECFPFLRGVKRKNKELILTMLSKKINTPLTSSAGRLFDAAAALLGICLYASYEAEGPIELEALCDAGIEGGYDFNFVKENDCLIIDTDGLFQGALKDLRKKRTKRIIATKFHNSMAGIILKTVKKLSRAFAIKDIALSGGVFQNKFLRTKVSKQLSDSGFRVFINKQMPVNDFNISLGQYYVSCHSRKD